MIILYYHISQICNLDLGTHIIPRLKIIIMGSFCLNVKRSADISRIGIARIMQSRIKPTLSIARNESFWLPHAPLT